MRVSGEGAFRAEKGDMSRQHAGGRFDVFEERRRGPGSGREVGKGVGGGRGQGGHGCIASGAAHVAKVPCFSLGFVGNSWRNLAKRIWPRGQRGRR